jgi:hypothetical protein
LGSVVTNATRTSPSLISTPASSKSRKAIRSKPVPSSVFNTWARMGLAPGTEVAAAPPSTVGGTGVTVGGSLVQAAMASASIKKDSRRMLCRLLARARR